MAVSDFNAPNLAPNYAGVTDQLKTAANLALKKPSILDAGTQTVNAVDEYAKNKEKEQFEVGKLYLQHQFDTELNRQQQEFQKRGETQVDDETIANAKQEFGVDISRFKGTWVNPDALEKFIMEKHSYLEDEGNKKKIQAVMNDPKLTPQEKAAKIAGLSSSTKEVTQEAAKAAFEKPKQTKALRYADPTSATGFRYAQTLDALGRAVQSPDDLEAPPDKAAGKSNADTKKNLSAYAKNMKDALDKTKTGMAGKAQSLTAAVKGMVGGDSNDAETSAKYYDDNRKAFSVGMYRMVTGDTRLSDSDSERALGLVPPLTDSPSVRARKWKAIQSAISEVGDTTKVADGATDADKSAAFNNFLTAVSNKVKEQETADRDALKWAKAHPEDPRSAHIIEVNK